MEKHYVSSHSTSLMFHADFVAQTSQGVCFVKKVFVWIGISLGALVVIAFIGLSVMAAVQRALYMARYARRTCIAATLKWATLLLMRASLR